MDVKDSRMRSLSEEEGVLFSKYAVHVESLRVSKHYLIVFDSRLMADLCFTKLVSVSNPDHQSDKEVWDWINDRMLVLAQIQDKEILPGDASSVWEKDNYGKTMVLNRSSVLVPDLEI